MADRDPRRDPRPGDVLLCGAIEGNITPNRGGFVREVSAIRNDKVEWTVGRLGYEMPIADWQRWNANAEVLHVAD